MVDPTGWLKLRKLKAEQKNLASGEMSGATGRGGLKNRYLKP